MYNATYINETHPMLIRLQLMQYRHHLELTWLEDCLALKETLNFSKASASRYVTQPAFSRRIQSLEEWVGTPLFERSKRGVTLTKAGEVFTDQLPELIHSLYTLKSDTLEVAGNKQPSLVFSATHALSFSFVPHLLKQSDKIAKFGSFRLLSDSLNACEKMMRQGDSQFLLCHHHPHMHLNLNKNNFMSIRLGFDTLIPFSKPDSETLKPLWNINNKIQFPYLSFSSQSGLGRIIANTASINRITHNINVAFVADLAATLLAMVRSGDGVAWIPQSLARQDIEAKTIVTAAEKESNLWVPIEIRLYRPAKRMPPDAEELWE
ncbi:LysR family transcriptional regulator, partial [Salmonella enterica subsp. enterica serovar Kentucky]|nr:LysR family transcriptional regulator [Salmonella enterica subsp. enterica]ECL9748377.1 LysR family transcriptional regulator [Salmonella enterica subsp. enterica serovar Kentucky]